jgi:hypothetical protein
MQNYQHDDYTDFSLVCGLISVNNKEGINIRTHYTGALFVCIYKHGDGAKLWDFNPQIQVHKICASSYVTVFH